MWCGGFSWYGYDKGCGLFMMVCGYGGCSWYGYDNGGIFMKVIVSGCS